MLSVVEVLYKLIIGGELVQNGLFYAMDIASRMYQKYIKWHEIFGEILMKFDFIQ
jgi:hypothetical protein